MVAFILIWKSDMQQLHELYKNILENGTESLDRTGVGTIKLIAQQLRFDLSAGFPAVTTKQLAFKTMLAELLFFLQSIPDRRIMQEIMHGDFKEERYDIWKGNCLDVASKNPVKFNGYNLGNMYPMYWRQMYKPTPTVQKVKVKHDIDNTYIETPTCPYDITDITPTTVTGKVFISSDGSNIHYLGIDSAGLNYFKHSTGTIVRCPYYCIDYANKVVNYDMSDYFKPHYYDGYMGAPADVLRNDPVFHDALALWNSMFDCSKISVSPRWLNFSNFLSDIRAIPLFFEYLDSKDDFVLDCTYFGSTVYSRNTCAFIPVDVACSYKEYNTVLEVQGVLYKSFNDYYTKNVGSTGCSDAFSTTYFESHRELNHRYLTSNNEYVYRKGLFIDQVQELIDNIVAVKENPNHPAGRRLIMDSWNPSWSHDSVLGICHPWVQFFVIDGKLSCSFNMRSSDAFLGLPLNIASYAVLTHMLAQITGLDVGELIWNGGDCHIYSNHIEQVKEQLSRTPHELPVLKIDSTCTSIDDFSMNSFVLVGYSPDPAIKAPMAV